MTDLADLVFLNGEVLTVDPTFSIVEAIAVRAGTIMAVGSTSEIRELVGPATEVINLHGRTALPGINDSHIHACAFGSTRPPLALDLSYPTVTSIADIVKLVGQAAEQMPAGAWIMGIGWEQGYLTECKATSDRLPTRVDLDPVTPDHPVCLQDFSGHMIWANSRAMALAGINRETQPPPGGVILTDSAGEPVGLFQESAQDLLQRALPPLTPARREAAIRTALATLHAEGITSFTEPGLGPGGQDLFGSTLSAETLDAYVRLAGQGELKARVSVLLLPSGMTGSVADTARVLEEYRPDVGADPRRLRIVGVKFFADGIPPNKTSWLREEFSGGGNGQLCVRGETDTERVAELREMIYLAHAAGYQVGIHATGDRTIDEVVEAYVAAIARQPRADTRHCVIHGDLPSQATLEKMARYGFGLNVQPAIKWLIADLMDKMLGPERSTYQFPWRSAFEAGVKMASSSDAPVTYPNWRQAIATMLLRESKATGQVSGPKQRIGLVEAVRAHTINGAWQDFAETWKGSLEVGKVADICVLDGNLRATDPHDLPALGVAMTIFEGEIVHRAGL